MSAFAGTRALAGLALRRERIGAPLSAALLAGMVAGMANTYTRLFPDAQARQSWLAELQHNPALLAFGGQIPDSSLGSMVVWRIGDTVFTLTALMAALMVLRHTRAEEQTGRRELLGAAAVGRCAPLAAGLLVTSGVCLLTGLLSALALVGLGFPTRGSLALGAAVVAAGWFFAAAAGLAAQLTATLRPATGLAVAALGGSYLLRFASDGGGPPWLIWLSPLGWSHLVQPFAQTRWWVLALPLGAALALGAAALLLVGRRDLGAGLLPARQGPAEAPGLRSPLALAWRLHRGTLLGWAAGFGVAGLFAGSLAGAMPRLAGSDNPLMQEFFRRYTAGPGATLTDAYVWLITLSLGYTAALYPMLAALRLRDEERSGRADLLLSAPVGRARWAGGHILIALLGTLAVLAAGGAALALGGGGARALEGALIQAPAVWTMGGLAVLLVGALPRWAAPTVWTAWLLVNLVGEVFAPIAGLDYRLVSTLVPFAHLPNTVAGGTFSAAPLAALTCLAAALTAAGVGLLGRRDIG